jgi:hypothetical protein
MAESSAALLLKRLNTALRMGGCASVETSSPLISRENEPLLGNRELPLRLRDAGFGAVRAWSPLDGLIAELIEPGIREAPASRTVLVSGRKVSNYAVWRYALPVNGMPLRSGGRLAAGPAV